MQLQSFNISRLSVFIFLFFFFLCALHDGWKKCIPRSFFVIFLLIGIPFCLGRLIFQDNILTLPLPSALSRIFSALLSFLPGLLLFFCSILTEEALGFGDGFFLIVAGCYLPFQAICLMLVIGILTSGIAAIAILSYGCLKNVSMKGKSIPFIPCMLPALYWILAV